MEIEWLPCVSFLALLAPLGPLVCTAQVHAMAGCELDIAKQGYNCMKSFVSLKEMEKRLKLRQLVANLSLLLSPPTMWCRICEILVHSSSNFEQLSCIFYNPGGQSPPFPKSRKVSIIYKTYRELQIQHSFCQIKIYAYIYLSNELPFWCVSSNFFHSLAT